MSVPQEPAGAGRREAPSAAEPQHYADPVLLEEDECVAPRPEEEIADLLRADPAD